jgi:two-component system NtrC family sensor kinase
MALSLVGPLVGFGFAAKNSRDLHIADAESQTRNAALVLREQASRVFETHELILDTTERAIRGMDWATITSSETVHHELARLKAGRPHIHSIWITAPDGKSHATSLRFPAPNVDVTDREHFRVLRQRDVGVFVSAPVQGRTSGVQVFNVARRLPSSDGTFNGVIVAAIEQAYFSKLWSEVMPGLPHLTSIVRRDGEVLAVEPWDWVKAPPRTGPVFANAVSKSDRGTFHARSVATEIERLYAYERIGDRDLYLTVAVDNDVILGAWRRDTAGYAAFALAAALGLFTLSFLAWRLTGRELAAATSALQERERRERAEAAMREVQHFEALGRLTGGVAHDFNNLLMIVQGSAQALKRRIAKVEDGKVQAFLEAILTAVQRGESLTRQLLAFSRRSAHEPTNIDLKRSAPDLQATLSRSTRGNIQISLSVPDGTWPVYADASALEIALINLAVNARDAMPDGGRLTVRATNATLTDGRDGGTGLRGEFVALIVRDTGTGIPEPDLKHVFEPFFTTKQVGKGTGLGLSQVYGFTKQSGGAVTIASEMGRGTTVTLYLPRGSEEARAITYSSRLAEPVTGKGRVLLVEDNPEVAKATESLLVSAGFEARHVISAEAAFAALEQGEIFDVVLSDIVMEGGMSGLDLSKRLRQDRPDLPVVLMTGYSEALAEGSIGEITVLSKPFGEMELVTALGPGPIKVFDGRRFRDSRPSQGGLNESRLFLADREAVYADQAAPAHRHARQASGR